MSKLSELRKKDDAQTTNTTKKSSVSLNEFRKKDYQGATSITNERTSDTSTGFRHTEEHNKKAEENLISRKKELEQEKRLMDFEESKLGSFISNAGIAAGNAIRNNVNRIYNNTPTTADRNKKRQQIESELNSIETELQSIKYEKYRDEKIEDNFLGNFKANYTLNDLQQEMGYAYNDYLENPTEANKRKADIISEAINSYATNNAEALEGDEWHNWLSKSAAGHLPQLFDQLRAGLTNAAGGAGTAAAGAFALGQLGPQVGLPEELVTVPGAALWGGRAGYVAGVGEDSYKLMRGMAYKRLIDEGVDETIAREAANDEGFVNALIESGGAVLDVLLIGTGAGTAAKKTFTNFLSNSSNKFLRNIGEKAIKGTVQTVGEQGLKQLGKKALIGGGKLVLGGASEVLEESSQEVVGLANAQRLKDGGDTGFFNLATEAWDKLRNLTPEEQKQVNEAGWEGFKIYLMFGGSAQVTSGLINTTIDNANAKRYSEVGKTFKDLDTVDDVIATGMESDPSTTSYKLATQLKAKKDSGKEVTDAEIGQLFAENVKTIRQEETNQRTQQEAITEEQNAVQESVSNRVEPTLPLTTKTAQIGNTELTRPRRTQPVTNVSQMVSSLGDSGAKAFSTYYKHNQDIQEYYNGFSRYYESGLANIPRDRINTVYANNIDLATQEAAYLAGQNDRAVSLQKEIENAKFATVYGKEGGFIQNDISRKIPKNKLKYHTIQTLNELGRATGSKITMAENIYDPRTNELVDANGVNINGVITVSVNAENPYIGVGKHEVAHSLQRIAPTEYRAYRDYAVGVVAGGESTTTLVNRYIENARRNNVELTTEKAMDEIAADFTGDLFEDEKALRQFIRDNIGDNRTMLEKVLEAISDFIETLKKVFKKNKKAMDEAAKSEFGATVEQLEKAQALYKEALQATMKKTKEASKQADSKANAKADNTQYSLKDSDIVETKEENYWKSIPDATKTRLSNDYGYIDIMEKADGSNSIYSTYVKPEFRRQGIGTALLQKAIDKYKKLTGQFSSEQSVKNAYKLGFRTPDNLTLEETLVKQKEESSVYMEYTNDVQFSLKDSEGRTLTEAQVEFFEDSVVRDENGNLLVVYHGTPNGGFTEFSHKDESIGRYRYGDDNVNFFTGSKEMALSYTEQKGEAKRIKVPDNLAEAEQATAGYYEGYLNITNPYTVDAQGREWLYVVQPASEKIESEINALSSLTDSEQETLTDIAMDMAKKYTNRHKQADELFKAMPKNIKNKIESVWDDESKIRLYMQFYYGSSAFEEYKSRNSRSLSTNDIVSDVLERNKNGANYDGIIIKNVVDYGADTANTNPSDVYVTLNASNQFKDVDNTNPTSVPDIRFSLKTDSEGRKLSEGQEKYFKDSKVRDNEGKLKPVYHGTKRADRVGYYFDPTKATSGPMAFFTDDKEIATNYSKSKNDTSISREATTEYDLFKANGKDLDTYWNSLTPKQKQQIAEKGNNIGFDEDWENVVYSENASRESFGDQYEWRLKNEHKGNAIKTLYDIWIQDGNLMFEDMAKFKDILTMAGIENVEYLDQYKEDPKVYEVYMNLTNPFNTSNMNEEMFNKLQKASEKATIGEQYTADAWDKSNIEPKDWISMLRDDIKDGTTHSWTIIPDWVTDVLKAEGYDGIQDTGGKYSGLQHIVYIPFYSNQIKDVNNLNPTTENDDIRFSLKDQSELLKENARLKEYNERLKEQMKVTKTIKQDKKALEKLTKDLIKEYNIGGSIDVETLLPKIQSLYDFIANEVDEDGNKLAWDSLKPKATEIAKEIVERATTINDDLYQEYSGLRQYLRDTKIMVTPELKSSITDYNDFRKANFGRLKLTNEGISVDRAYQELAGMYPEFFDTDKYITQADQLYHIEEVLNSLQPYESNPFEYDIASATEWLANDLIERFYDIPQAKPTFADKQQKKIVKAQAKVAEKLTKVIERKEKQVAKTKEHYKTKEANMSDRRKKSTYIKKIRKHYDVLYKMSNKPTDTQHIPEFLKKPVAEFLKEFNFTSNRTRLKGLIDDYNAQQLFDDILSSNAYHGLDSLQEAYQGYASNEGMKSFAFDPDLVSNIQQAKKAVKGIKRLSELNNIELENLYRIMLAVHTSITEYNTSKVNGQKIYTAELADIVANELSKQKQKMKQRDGIAMADRLLNIDMLTPVAFFDELGGSDGMMAALFKEVRKGMDKAIYNIRTGEMYIKKVLEGVDIKEWTGKKAKVTEFKLENGNTIMMTPAQVMSLYRLVKRPASQDHILKGGIAPSELDMTFVKTVSSTKEQKVAKKRLAESILKQNVTFNDIQNILGSLTPEQMKVADEIQRFFTDVASVWGNEVTMQLYGYNKFNDPNYFPIRSDKDYIDAIGGFELDKTLANAGFTKSLKEHASNPIMIEDIFDVFTGHMQQMANYNGFVVPLNDIQKVYNFRRNQGGSVKAEIKRVKGSKAQEYFTNLMKDINGGVKNETGTELAKTLLRNYKSAAMGLNLRVIVQQPTALIRASAMINPKYLLMGTPMTPITASKKWRNVILKYSAIAQWKDWGYYSLDVGRQMKDVLLDNKGINDKLMAAIGKADQFAWTRLWNAVEFEVKDTNPKLTPKSEQFYLKVAERFNDIIDRTQVTDTVLHRSAIMRSNSMFAKLATSFMSEPMQSFNLMRNAIVQAKLDKTPQSKANAARAFTATFVSIVAAAAAAGLLDMWRGKGDQLDDEDDEEELTWLDKYLRIIANNTIDNYAGMIPYARDVYNLLSGWDIERMDMQGMSMLTQALTRAKSIAFPELDDNGNRKESPHTIYSVSKGIAEAVGYLTGLPVKNGIREIDSIVNNVLDSTDNFVAEYSKLKMTKNIKSSSNRSAFADILYEAAKAEDLEAYETIFEDMVDNGIERTKINGSLVSKAKKDDPKWLNSDFARKVGLKNYIAPTEETNKEESYSINFMSDTQHNKYTNLREDRIDDLEEDLKKMRLDEKTYNELMDAAYSFAEKTALLDASGGKVVEIDGKDYLQVGGKKYPFEYPDWIEAAENADDLGITTAEFLKLKTEYSVAAMTSDKAYNAVEAGVELETYLEFKEEIKDIKSDYYIDDYGNPILKKDGTIKYVSSTHPGSRRNKVMDILDTMGLTYEEYKALMEAAGFTYE